MAEWSRLTATVIADYIRGAEDKFMRERKLLKMLKSRGQIEYNKSGNTFEWRVPYKRGTVVTNNGAQSWTPSAIDRHKVASLTYVGYGITELMTKREQLMGKGPEAIIDYYKEMADFLVDDITEKFAEDLYNDVSASGNSAKMTGVDSMMAYTQTVNIATGVARTANAADIVVAPSDTYATLLTDLGNYAGTWKSQTGIASTWPAGRGDDAYDFFSPTEVNYTSTALNGSSATWAVQCESAIRYGNDHLKRNKGSNVPDALLLDRDLYRQFKEKYAAKERVHVGADLETYAFGFPDHLNFEGLTVTSEFGMPTAVGYYFNIKNMHLRSMQEALFKTTGPWFEKLKNSWCVIVDNLGQLKFNSPRYFGKLVAAA